MKNILNCILLTGLLFGTLHGYENTKAHPAINRAVVVHAEAYLADKLTARTTLGITSDNVTYTGPAVTNSGFVEGTYAEGEKSLTSLEWICHGGYSADEPELAAALRHFYDPTGHSDGRKYLTNRGTYWEGIMSNPGIDAIEWALGDTPNGDGNKWTLAKGKEYLVLALEMTQLDLKNKYLAKALRCLGEVLHNTGDMGCPPHVRNDSHAAPLGYSGGWALGSPDPYEEMFDPEWASLYDDLNPDPGLESVFGSATSIRSIHEKLAEFTNRNFFTEQTINGTGEGMILATGPINKEDGDYPEPQLQDFGYDYLNFTYFRRFPSGNLVKMCKDDRLFVLRGMPYMDRECARSQASELVPNILCAGAHVIRLFLPVFEIVMLEALPDGTVRGRITHQPQGEYPETIYYSGPVEILDATTKQRIGTLDCDAGDFSGNVGGIQERDRLVAQMEFGGVRVQSPACDVGTKSMDEYNICNVNIRIHFKITSCKTIPPPETCETTDYVNDPLGPSEMRGSFSGTRFDASAADQGEHEDGNWSWSNSLVVILSPDLKEVEYLEWNYYWKDDYQNVNNHDKIAAEHIPLKYIPQGINLDVVYGQELGECLLEVVRDRRSDSGYSNLSDVHVDSDSRLLIQFRKGN